MRKTFPDNLVGCSFWAQALADRIHAHLDDCGGFTVDRKSHVESICRRLGVCANDRKMAHSRLRELVDVEYIVITGDRLWVPSWAWQQSDVDGEQEDLFAKYESKRAQQNPNKARSK